MPVAVVPACPAPGSAGPGLPRFSDETASYPSGMPQLTLSPRRLSTSALALAALVVTGLAPAHAQTGDWSQYRQDATNNTHVTSGLAEVFHGAIATANEVRATPVVAHGKVFVGNHDTGELQAFDLVTGELLWQAQAPNWVHSEMIHSGGQLFVGFGNRFFQDGPDGYRGTGESGVLSLDPDTGEILWRHDTPGEVMPTPVVTSGAVWAVTGDRRLYKLDPVSGAELDAVETGHISSMSSPAEHDGVLYFGGGAPAPYTFSAYDTVAEEFAWQREFPEFNRGLDDVPPAVDSGIVVTTANRTLLPGLAGPREEHTIVAMDVDTGRILWRDVIGTGPAPDNNRSGAPTIHDGTVYVGSPTTGAAYAYDLRTGERKWRNPVGVIKGAPVVDGDDVYFSTTTGTVQRLDTATGAVTGVLELEGALAPAGPIIVDDTLVVPSQSRHVYFTPLDEIPDATAGGAGPDGSVGGFVDGLVTGSVGEAAGSAGIDTGSIDAAY